MKKSLKNLFVLSLLFSTFACQNATFTKEQISEVTKEHQMIYVWSLNAILNQENKVSDFVFGGEEKNAIYVEDFRAALKDWWGVNNKNDLLSTINKLQNGKGHHQDFMRDYKGFFDITEEQFQKNLKNNPDYNDIDNLLWKNKTFYKEKGILGWDIVRTTALIGWGYQAEYLTMEEAYELSIITGTAVQKNFNSYKELSDNYLTGYLFWTQDYNKYNENVTKVKLLLEDPESAWNIFPSDYDLSKK